MQGLLGHPKKDAQDQQANKFGKTTHANWVWGMHASPGEHTWHPHSNAPWTLAPVGTKDPMDVKTRAPLPSADKNRGRPALQLPLAHPLHLPKSRQPSSMKPRKPSTVLGGTTVRKRTRMKATQQRSSQMNTHLMCRALRRAITPGTLHRCFSSAVVRQLAAAQKKNDDLLLHIAKLEGQLRACTAHNGTAPT